ncbi:MAG TPA: hypothetical protein VM095_03610, partial [Pyrinomonadaceae bacterium]|nr:hypothetical protein [Pyrinomonadaceae bacterium]
SPLADTRLLGLAVDQQGNVFAADIDNRRVLKVAPDGRVTTLLRVDSPWSPSGLAYSNNDLFILEFRATPAGTPAPRVRKLSPDGSVTLIASVGETNASALPRENAESERPVVERQGKATYALIGAGAGIFALTIIIIRRVLRKRFE